MYELFISVPITTIEQALAIRREMEALQASLIEILGAEMQSLIDEPAPAFKAFKPMSAAGRAKAKLVESTPAAVKPVKAGKKKRVVTAASRAKMAAAQKARWAKKNRTSTPAPVAKVPKKGRKPMSPEGRARIVAAQKARWAKVKGASAAVKPVKAAKAKRVVSPEARAKMAAAAKARWAKKKA